MHGVQAPGRPADARAPEGRVRRPEIQALRALAVAGVVVYHLWPGALPGGFVGVDVFFVISGFLITQHLAGELDRSGRISLKQFWAARIRRILPAALTVLLASMALLVLLMPRLTWTGNLSDIRAAALFYENWQLGAHAVDYLAGEDSPSLVQHYWSLSVEEQFYVAWPLLLLLAPALARRWGVRPRASLAVLLAVALTLSLAVSVLMTPRTPLLAFFATPARAWEFAAGGLLAVLLPRGRALSGVRGALLSWTGLVVLGGSLVLLSSANAFPGAVALVPVVAAVAFLAAGFSPEVGWSPARLVVLRPVQWLGDNSYSTYLWHWPLLIAVPWVVHGPLRAHHRLVVLAGTLVLAALTKRLVEDPVRSGRRWRARPRLAYASAVVGLAAVVGLTWTFDGQVRSAESAAIAEPDEQTRALVAAPKARSCFGAAAMNPDNECARPYRLPEDLDTAFAATDGRGEPCLQKFDADTPEFCTLGRRTGPTRTIAVVGNSHAWRLVPPLELYGEQHGWKVVVATRINCLGLTTTAVGSGGASPNCLAWSAAVRRQLLSLPQLDLVVFPSYRFAEDFTSGADTSAAQREQVRQQVLALWQAFEQRGTRVVVTEDVPGMRPTAAPECLAQARDSDDPCSVSRESRVRPNLTTLLAQQHPGLATYVPLSQHFCDASTCHAIIGGVVVYFDSHHVTTTYAKSFARYLGEDLEEAMSSPASPPLGKS